jgi:hypothetical protein
MAAPTPITARLPEQEARWLRLAAASAGVSVQVFAARALRAAVLHYARTPEGAPVAAALDGEGDGDNHQPAAPKGRARRKG